MQNSSYIAYYDDKYLFGRKRSGIPSTRGQKISFLDIIDNSDDILRGQQKRFGRQEEYGLLNRLDTPTSGLLLFARNEEIKKNYKLSETQGLTQKTYYAQVYGRPHGAFGWINRPIYHHAQLADRMTTDASKGRSRQQAQTYREYCEDDGKKAWLKVVITQGVRHQIRVHLASIGCAIVGDELYMSSSLRKRFSSDIDKQSIQLVSAGVFIDT